MELLVIGFLILLNGVFSMSEIALVSARKFKLEREMKEGNMQAKQALALATNPSTFLSTIQTGITLIGILTGVFSGKQLINDLMLWMSNIPLLNPYAETISTFLVVLAITYLTIVFGELIPKRLGLSFPEKIAMLSARPMVLLSRLAKPLVWSLSKISDIFFHLFGIKEKSGEIISEEEIKEIIQESAEGGEIRKIEEDMVKRVFALGDRKAGELMTHRRDLAWIDLQDSLKGIKEKIKQDRFAVYPVCDQSTDKLVGLITLQEIYEELEKHKVFNLQSILTKPFFVPENMGAYRVLESFKVNNRNAAIVVDEYGDIQGMITRQDVIDELLGDSTFQDKEAYGIFERSEGSWLVDGQFPYFELLDYFQLPKEKVWHGFTTVGGLFIHLTNHIPKVGEKVNWGAYELEIVDMDDQRIDKLLLTKINI